MQNENGNNVLSTATGTKGTVSARPGRCLLNNKLLRFFNGTSSGVLPSSKIKNNQFVYDIFILFSMQLLFLGWTIKNYYILFRMQIKNDTYQIKE